MRAITLTIALALLAVIAIVVVTNAFQRPVAAPSPSPTPTTTPTSTTVATTAPATAAATIAPTATPPAPAEVCRNDYIAGETPVVAPRKSGRFAEVAVDAVRIGPSTFGNTTRWLVRAFDPSGSPGRFELPLRASIRTGTGTELAIVGYEAGPPNAEPARVTDTVSIEPCDPRAVPGSPQRGKVVLIVHTPPIASGSYTLTLRDLGLPEGGTRDEVWSLTLTCTLSGGVVDCR